jgi:hypothetical protein
MAVAVMGSWQEAWLACRLAMQGTCSEAWHLLVMNGSSVTPCVQHGGAEHTAVGVLLWQQDH